MGTLDDPKLADFHLQIDRALRWSGQPNWQKTCEILNGMSMPDMLDEIWRIRGLTLLNGLSAFAPRATGVNVPRLRAALGACQDQPPGDFDGLVNALPEDQQFAIMSVSAVTQAPVNLNPMLWPKYYWSTRAVPVATIYDSYTPEKKKDDKSAHLAADVAAAVTANYPRGQSPTTLQVTLIYRNLDKWTLGTDDVNELDILHEPNISLQMSPDPNNRVTAQAAFSLINWHVKKNYGLIKPDVEFSLSPQVNLSEPGNNATFGLQAQVELHVTTNISLTASTAIGLGASQKAGDPADYGAMHYGPLTISPFMFGVLGHWDPP
jgi:hypothetical protein